MRVLLALLVLLLACETGSDRVLPDSPGPHPFATSEGRLALYRQCVADGRHTPCVCANVASGIKDFHRPGRMVTDPTILAWLEREVGLRCAHPSVAGPVLDM
jgi:hypothetical protein